MSGIKNIKKKLKGFRVRPPNVEVIKKVMLHIPYVIVFYVVNKCTWLYQYCRGSTVVDRLMVLLMNYPLAFKKLLPSIQPKSLAAGTIAAVSVWAVVYFKGKNGKKFRQGEEYGSARWGNEKDIAPFIDPVFENNILLTQTERLTMNSRPKKPKYARNKNVIVIGGSGSGKTRFYVKPQLMQMPDNVSFVVTDPKGTIIVECGKMLARGTPKKDKNGKILRDMCSKDDIGFDIYADFKLDIEILDENKKPEQQDEQSASSNAELLAELKDKLQFKYDRLELSAFTSKRTASSLDVAEQDFKYLTSSKPAFLSKANMTSAQKGTAMHTFMQFCDYSASKNDLEAEIERLVSMSFLTEEQANSLDRKKLTALFNGEFARRMFGSDNVYREIKVSSFVPVNEIEETDYTDEVLIQGIADCVFEGNGELVLVDYKTDRVDSEEELLERYKNQIAFYKKAVEKTLNKPVKEALLYSFSLNKVCIYK